MKYGVMQFLLFITNYLYSQNVGVGTTSPSIGKLEVRGVSGAGATSAVFGSDGAGISIQRNWPTIGFNQYRDLVVQNSQGRHMATGYACLMAMDTASGLFNMDMFPTAPAGSFTASGNRAFSFHNNGNINIFGSASSNTGCIIERKGYNQNGSLLIAGSLYHSYFSHGSTENTYIRGGLNSSKVYINDIPGGYIFLGGGSSKIGLNDYQPSATMEVNGDKSMKIASIVLTTNLIYSLDRQNASILRVTNNGSGQTAGIRGIGGGQEGMLLYIMTDLSGPCTGWCEIILNHNSTESIAEDRIITPDGSGVSLRENAGAFLVYSNERWRVIGYAP
ncbi:MAG: hypothetical protein RLZZ546_2204 [Bacteroidota bacterium]|jgi:hypothetical protein